MSRKKITKVLVLLLVLGLIFIQTCRVGASTLSLEGLIQGEGENGDSTDLNNLLNPSENTAADNTATNNTNTNTDTNTALPKTGTNENIIIGLMIICTLSGVYAFKKVKDYNM